MLTVLSSQAFLLSALASKSPVVATGSAATWLASTANHSVQTWAGSEDLRRRAVMADVAFNYAVAIGFLLFLARTCPREALVLGGVGLILAVVFWGRVARFSDSTRRQASHAAIHLAVAGLIVVYDRCLTGG